MLQFGFTMLHGLKFMMWLAPLVSEKAAVHMHFTQQTACYFVAQAYLNHTYVHTTTCSCKLTCVVSKTTCAISTT